MHTSEIENGQVREGRIGAQDRHASINKAKLSHFRDCLFTEKINSNGKESAGWNVRLTKLLVRIDSVGVISENTKALLQNDELTWLR